MKEIITQVQPHAIITSNRRRKTASLFYNGKTIEYLSVEYLIKLWKAY